MEEKKIKGRKRHISVDVLGLLICVSVHSAAISDREGAKLVIAVKCNQLLTPLRIKL